jgi:cytidine deaminase
VKVLKNTGSKTSVQAADELISAAAQARENAYAPYSRFKVGAAVLAEDGRIFTGSNVENASYGATMCAERSAIFGAISAGARKIKALAVIADYPKPVPPCGMCRQVLAEFGSDIDVVMANTAGQKRMENIATLLPLAFELEDRKKQ